MVELVEVGGAEAGAQGSRGGRAVAEAGGVAVEEAVPAGTAAQEAARGVAIDGEGGELGGEVTRRCQRGADVGAGVGGEDGEGVEQLGAAVGVLAPGEQLGEQLVGAGAGEERVDVVEGGEVEVAGLLEAQVLEGADAGGEAAEGVDEAVEEAAGLVEVGGWSMVGEEGVRGVGDQGEGQARGAA